MKKNKTTFARKLRKNSTDTEALLWSYLRGKRFEGIKFKRQAPLGVYIVDFVCYEKKLIIECDGSQHFDQRGYDQKRDTWLKAQGFKILRFWNQEVLQDREEFLEMIWKCLFPELNFSA